MTTKQAIDDAGREWVDRISRGDFLTVRGRCAGKIVLTDEIALWQSDDSALSSKPAPKSL
jgi:hypothetical protein